METLRFACLTTCLILIGVPHSLAAQPPAPNPIYLAGLSGTARLYVLDLNDRLLDRWDLPPVHSGLAVGDLDGDGEDEVIVGSGSYIEIRDRAGALRDAPYLRSTYFPFLAAGDVDGDGAKDLIAPEVVSNHIKIYSSIGFPPRAVALETGFDASFVEPISGLATGDVLGGSDGREEILLLQFRTSPFTEDRVVVFDRHGNELNHFDVGRFAHLGSGDTNGDGVDEIVVARPEHAFPTPNTKREVFIYDGSGALLRNFGTQAIANPGFPLTDLAVGDVNQDGIDEILVGNATGGGVIVYDGAGNEIGRVGQSQSLALDVGVAIGRRPLDSDGDGLLDRWERLGVDADGNGTIDLDLPALGANPRHKDLFVELDHMVNPHESEDGAGTGSCGDGIDNGSDGLTDLDDLECGRALTQSGVRKIKEAFAAAPIDAGGVANPDGKPGINLWIDTGGQLDPNGREDAAGDRTCRDGIDNGSDGATDLADSDCLIGDDLGGGNPIPATPICNFSDGFYPLKKVHFDARARERVFRYGMRVERSQCNGGPLDGRACDGRPTNCRGGTCVAGQCVGGASGGQACAGVTNCPGGSCTPGCDNGGRGELGGNDFFVSNLDAGSTMHELGHNLDLNHGGDDSENCKPNYVSVMNYDQSFGIAQTGGASILDFSPPRAGSGRGMAPLPELVENELDETTILDVSDPRNMFVFVDALMRKVRNPLDQQVDWNANGAIDAPPIGPVNINTGVGVPPSPSACVNSSDTQRLTGFDDWTNIALGFRQFGDSRDSAIDPVLDPEPTDEELESLQVQLNTTDLAITKTATPDAPRLGASFVYRIAIVNEGPNPASAVRLVDTLAPEVVYEGDSAGCVSSGQSGTLSCALEEVLQRRSKDIEIRVKSTGACERGLPKSIRNVASASNTAEFAGSDPDPGDNSASLTITPVDDVPPELRLSVSPSTLRPPDHRLVEIMATVEATDACDSSPAVRLVFITSNEPDEGLGDGDTPGDVQDASFGTDDRIFRLRAERSGMGSDRRYTITYEATDASGNTSTGHATVSVPVRATKR